jgi:hypothetical protein
MLNARLIVFTALLVLLLTVGAVARSQDTPREDLTPCAGSGPEPVHSAEWAVAFCNRTGHDIVVEFHDNDCPAGNWGRRGDVYRKSMRRGESATFSLCYANEPQAGSPKPGVPTLRIPGGKGIVTTWSVVGDCGDRSEHLYLDARTFYDRGDYKTGIVLLQYPSGASHCVEGVPGAAGMRPPPPPPPPPLPQTEPRPQSAASAPPPVPPPPPSVAGAPTLANTPKAGFATPTSSDKRPSLYAVIDDKDTLGRTVRVFAKNEPGVPDTKCNFTLALTFSDGGSWNDHAKAEVPGAGQGAGQGGDERGGQDSPVATRKYLKSVSKAVLSNTTCSPK